ncbi:hypothetical protein GGI1_18416 [Acidithiobacillus sp. GGI-221]|uniref:hypothetical protein n=1 Tax=Acidithiobacillus ferrooxidans TaxID=920 RepID=UPI0002187EEC|nr:hypothetical protein [Acidithiobacillus ferrooxidans]EGQ63297.1 hypothetical protein GGI1_18416 [Acidithiobacillus sp. GGI-221]BDB15724.1 hypothetical protein ANFP_30440 [Acidithiobacillus ferrooxidans]
MIKSSAYGVRHLVVVATLALLCGLTSTAVRADDDMSLGLAIPGLSVFLGNGLGYYAPPPPVYYAPPPAPFTMRLRPLAIMWHRCVPEFMSAAAGSIADLRLGPGAGGTMMTGIIE